MVEAIITGTVVYLYIMYLIKASISNLQILLSKWQGILHSNQAQTFCIKSIPTMNN